MQHPTYDWRREWKRDMRRVIAATTTSRNVERSNLAWLADMHSRLYPAGYLARMIQPGCVLHVLERMTHATPSD